MKMVAAIAWVLLAGPLWAQAPSGEHKPADQTATQQGAATADAPKIDPVKEADIRKLLEVSGAKETMAQQLLNSEKLMAPSLAQSLPPGDYRDQLIALFFERFRSKFDSDALVQHVVVIYDKYLSDEDVRGLTQFYQTPLGKKTLSVLPQILNETTTLGMKMGEKAGRESMQEVLAEHPDLAEAMKAAARAQQPQQRQ